MTPLACDPLVYSLAEWRGLPGWSPLLAMAPRKDTRWLGRGSHPVGKTPVG
jgi:hypothetical protein